MSNKWVQFVKKYARDHNISYMCAVTDKKCRQAYLESTRTNTRNRSKSSTRNRSKSSTRNKSKSSTRNKSSKSSTIYQTNTYSYSPISDIDYWIKK